MDKIINKVVRELSKIKEIQGISLFGSQVKGTQKPYSDYDLCIFTKEGTSSKIKKDILSYASPKIDISLFSHLPLYVQYRVFKEGKILFQRKNLFLHRLEVRTLTSYLDFKNLLDRHIEQVLA
ncbi:nucleotidyltransferase domain-containing protein [Candidatus Woesearchaeota archaeon]|nr:nucleotidyltransferase domain-containing protein [Candidatus Woesearchaeota archaeon]